VCTSCESLEKLLGRKDQDKCLQLLCDLIATNTNSIFGLDFPFGLPQEVTGGQRWKYFILQFPEKYTNAGTFREKCRKQTGGRELKRRSEHEMGAPLSPYNLRLYKQTYYGIRNILYPLITTGLACAPPMQSIN
jgi:hypothetical protein